VILEASLIWFFSPLRVKSEDVEKGLESSLGPVSCPFPSGKDLLGVP
jgi:hypothetical protein